MKHYLRPEVEITVFDGSCQKDVILSSVKETGIDFGSVWGSEWEGKLL